MVERKSGAREICLLIHRRTQLGIELESLVRIGWVETNNIPSRASHTEDRKGRLRN